MKDWAIDLECRMKKNGIRWKDVAAKMGWTIPYTSNVINSEYQPKQAQERIEQAINELIENR